MAVPRPPGTALTTLRAMRRDSLGPFPALRREYGPIVRVPVPGARLYLVSDPAAVHEGLTATGRTYAKGSGRSTDPDRPGFQPLQRILGMGLLTSAGEHWRRQRRLNNPLLHPPRIAPYCAAFARPTPAKARPRRESEIRDAPTENIQPTPPIRRRTPFCR